MRWREVDARTLEVHFVISKWCALMAAKRTVLPCIVIFVHKCVTGHEGGGVHTYCNVKRERGEYFVLTE